MSGPLQHSPRLSASSMPLKFPTIDTKVVKHIMDPSELDCGSWLQVWLRQNSPGHLGAVMTHPPGKALARAAARAKAVQGDQ